MIDLSIQGVEFELGFDDEMEGWLCLQYPSMSTELEESRRKADEHSHRKLVTRIVNAHRKQYPLTLEWTGSAIGRPVYIVFGEAQGPDEVGIDELTKALSLGKPEPARSILKQLMETKRVLGGRLIEATSPLHSAPQSL